MVESCTPYNHYWFIEGPRNKMAFVSDYFRSGGDLVFLEWISWLLIVGGLFIVVASILGFRIPYGRYGKTKLALNLYMSSRTAWLLQELPSVVFPLYFSLTVGGKQLKGEVNPNIVLLAMFLIHYLQR